MDLELTPLTNRNAGFLCGCRKAENVVGITGGAGTHQSTRCS